MMALLRIYVCSVMSWLPGAYHPSSCRPGAGTSGSRGAPLQECGVREAHLSLGDNGNMVLMWRTHEDGCTSRVFYGQSDEPRPSKPLQVYGSIRTVTGESMCGEPASEESFSAYVHIAVLKGMQADGSSWWYQIEGSDTVHTFQSAPRTGPQSDFSFIAFGDMGQSDSGHKSPGAGKTAEAIAREVEQRPVDLIVHAGDISYASGKHHRWNHFMDSIEPFASRTPYMISIGNYDYGYEGPSENDPSGAASSFFLDANDSGGECGAMAAARFAMPGAWKGDNPPFWYSFDMGSMHFTVISTEHDCSPGSKQYRWLERDLSSVDRCRTPWLALMLHRPMYVVYPHLENREIGEHLREFLEPLLLHHRVDLTIAGHVHTYFRTCPVRDGVCTEDGITHFVAGTGGHELTNVEEGTSDSWLTGDYNDFGFLRFEVAQDSLQAHFIHTASGKVVDRMTLRARKGICYDSQ